MNQFIWIMMVLFAACKEVQPLPALAREMEDVSVELKGSSALEYARELNLCAKQKTPEQCYGVDANQVQILIGKDENRNASTDRNEIRFNTTSLILSSTRQNSIVTAHIHVFKNAISEDVLFQLKNEGCDTSAVRMQLYRVLDGAASSVVATASLGEDDLARAGWIVFPNVTDLYEHWVNDSNHQEQSLLILADEACNTEVKSSIVNSYDQQASFLVAFVSVSRENMTQWELMKMNANGISKRTSQQEQLNSTDETCGLHSIQINPAAVGEDTLEQSVEFSVCRGTCPLPSAHSTLYTTTYARYKYFLHNQNPESIPPPCCVPKSYAALSYTVFRDNLVTIEYIPNAIAVGCQCL